MTEQQKPSSSSDHWMEQKGVAWEDSMKKEDFCPYIPKDEFELRSQRAKELMVKHGLDAVILFAYGNKQYYGGFLETNYRFTDRWRHCLIVSQDHDPVFVGEAVLNYNLTKTTWIKDKRLWSSVKLWRLPLHFLDAFVGAMSDLHLDNKVIGLEYGPGHMNQVSPLELREIEAALPNARFVAADPVIWEQKMIKTDWEIALFREACSKMQRIMEGAWKTIRPGIPERDVHRVVWEGMVREDMYNTPSWNNPQLFLCGTDAPGRWRLVTPPFYERTIREGDQGFADGGLTYKGYCTDFQRCFYVGKKLPSVLADLSRWGRDAYLNTVKSIRPGMRGCDVFRVAQKEIYRQDFNQLVPIDFVGDSIGTLTHEPPFLGDDDLTELQPGMVITVEVGCFGSDLIHFGNMPEDMWLVTDKGLELLGLDLPRDIWLCG
jgi:Xaa-Pro aminopeptidase